MKKKLFGLAALMLVVLCTVPVLAACGGAKYQGHEIVGVWERSYLVTSKMTVEFTASGKLIVKRGTGTPSNYKFTIADDIITIKDSILGTGTLRYVVSEDGTKLTLTWISNYQYEGLGGAAYTLQE